MTLPYLSVFEQYLTTVIFRGEAKYSLPDNATPAGVEAFILSNFKTFVSCVTPGSGDVWCEKEAVKAIKPLLGGVVKFLTMQNSSDFIDELLPTEMNALVIQTDSKGICISVIVGDIIPKVTKPCFTKKSELRRYIKRAHMRYWELPEPQGIQLSLAV